MYVIGVSGELQVLALMEQLNKDAVYEVEQIIQRIANIERSVEEHAKIMERPESEPGGVGSNLKHKAGELRNELEGEKRDQDNRWASKST